MNRVLSPCAMIVVLSVLPSLAAGQQPSELSAEHRRLAVFTGTWTCEGAGPLGAFSLAWTLTSVAGGYFYRGTATIQTGASPVEMVDIIGYKPERMEYSWYRYASDGDSWLGRGWAMNDTWYWTLDDVVWEGKVTRWQQTQTLPRPDSLTFRWERSVEGAPWEPMDQGTCTKSR